MPLLIDVLATPGGAIVQAFKEQFRDLRTGLALVIYRSLHFFTNQILDFVENNL